MADNNNNNNNNNTMSSSSDNFNHNKSQQQQPPAPQQRPNRRRRGRGGGRNTNNNSNNDDTTITDTSHNNNINQTSASSSTSEGAVSGILRANAPTFVLTPSQAIRSSSTNNNNNNNKTNSSTTTVIGDNNSGAVGSTNSSTNPIAGKNKSRKGGGKKGGGPGRDGNGNGGPITTNNNNNTGNTVGNAQQKSKTNNSTPNKKKNKKKYPWRKFIPNGTVDPITLEDLIGLEYPPFAVCADDPYIPVPVWPVLREEDQGSKNDDNNNKPSVEELNRQRLAEQWGTSLLSNATGSNNDEKKAILPLSERPLNLYDGRALAYYLVSQLQFIDPLNRRDLTRPELLNLDKYLIRHGFTDVNVTEAYDAKGITLSTAGSAATTAQGRADILQQMAQQLLNSLFTGHSVSSIPNPTTHPTSRRSQAASFSLQEQYAAMQRQEQQQARFREAQLQQHQNAGNGTASGFGGDADYYGSYEDEDDGRIMIIDDDENPGLRGGVDGGGGGMDFPSLNETVVPSSRTGNVFSSSRITDRYGTGSAPTAAAAFPPLSALSNSTTTGGGSDVDGNGNKKPPTKASKTLSKITAVVKKTSEEEKQRQWEAREAARRKAMMSNLAFGVKPFVLDRSSQGMALAGQSSSVLGSGGVVDGPTLGGAVSEEQLQRNRAFAEALGVKLKTQRHYSSGWSRPVDSTNHRPNLDEYGMDLDAALYPDILIAVAKQKIPLLLKLEKKWRTFLMDDKAASLPLNPMDKPSRTLVHHYAEYWSLKTESFDPEPKRYVHCVKLLETKMPYPLLSEVVTHWRGPLPDISRVHLSDLESQQQAQQQQQQTAGQSSRSREIPPPPERVPSHLKARSFSPTSGGGGGIGGVDGRYNNMGGGTAATAVGGGGQLLTMMMDSNGGAPNAVRSNALLGRERPKLDLAPRTVPLELPPYDPKEHERDSTATATYDAAEDLRKREARIVERKQKEREAEERKRLALEKVFASDDEDEEEDKGRDNRGRPRAVNDGNDSDDEWGDEPQAVYDGSDDEE
jgi:hypothetical protein